MGDTRLSDKQKKDLLLKFILGIILLIVLVLGGELEFSIARIN